jgi:hypothetical protein
VRIVLVSLASGPGVVRMDNGALLVTGAVADGGGTYLREADPFHPTKSWVDEHLCVVGGLLPPGAVSAIVVDDEGARLAATVAEGAYVALLEQPNDGHEAIVCCRDAAGVPVRRPWASDYQSVRVTDAEESCPACGAIDWDEYTPFETWRGGRVGPNGTVPNPVVSCRVCGHEEPEGNFVATSAHAEDSENEATTGTGVARTVAKRRKRRWGSTAMTLAATQFPIYGAEGWSRRLRGSSSEGEHITEIKIDHYESANATSHEGDQPRVAVFTKREDLPSNVLGEARQALERWVHRDISAQWPDASRAAITLWLRARDRESRAAALGAQRSEQLITIEDTLTSVLMLKESRNRWVAVARHADLTITVAGRNVEPGSLRLEAIADPVADLIGPEPRDA